MQFLNQLGKFLAWPPKVTAPRGARGDGKYRKQERGGEGRKFNSRGDNHGKCSSLHFRRERRVGEGTFALCEEEIPF